MSECLLFFSKNLLGMAHLLPTYIRGGIAVRHILFHLMFFAQCIPCFGGYNLRTKAILGLQHHILLFPLASPFNDRIHPGLFLSLPRLQWDNPVPHKSDPELPMRHSYRYLVCSMWPGSFRRAPQAPSFSCLGQSKCARAVCKRPCAHPFQAYHTTLVSLCQNFFIKKRKKGLTRRVDGCIVCSQEHEINKCKHDN